MKNNVRIIVQNLGETGAEYAKRLEEICEAIKIQESQKVTPTIMFMTSASDGRQTATIQFFTKIH